MLPKLRRLVCTARLIVPSWGSLITNIALRKKAHGAASQILISLTQDGQRIALEIADNGIGFDTTTVARGASPTIGMGLRTMEYRASLIGGVVPIEKKPNGGTLVRCLILHEVAENG